MQIKAEYYEASRVCSWFLFFPIYTIIRINTERFNDYLQQCNMNVKKYFLCCNILQAISFSAYTQRSRVILSTISGKVHGS